MKRLFLFFTGFLLCAVAPAPAARLTAVADVSTVCMVTNRFMGVPQIPVTVERRRSDGLTAKTYYGCCQGCVKKVQDDEGGVRHAVDPQTGNTVDKADAVIARDAMGQVFYFESEESFRRFNGEGGPSGQPR